MDREVKCFHAVKKLHISTEQVDQFNPPKGSIRQVKSVVYYRLPVKQWPIHVHTPIHVDVSSVLFFRFVLGVFTSGDCSWFSHCISLLLFPSSFKFAQFILEYSTYEKIHWTWSSPAKLKDSKLSTKRSAFSTMQAMETKLQWRSKLLGQLTWCSLKLTLSPPLPLSPKQCWILNCTLWKHNHMVTIWFYQHCRKGERVCLLTLAKKWSLVRCFEVGCVFQKFPKNFSPQL